MQAALIGLGMVADTHVNAIAGTQGRVTLAGVCSRSADKAQAFASRHATLLGHTPALYASVDDIAADSGIDFVILCTPPDARQHIVSVLSAAGKPILMEKPIERTLQAAEDIVVCCEQARTPLGIVFQTRLRESARALADHMASGELGPLAFAEIVVPWWREQSYYDEPGRGTYARDGGGVLISQAIHTLDLALQLTGPVARVQAMAGTTDLHRMEAEDVVSAGLRFASGAYGSLMASTASFPGAPESITLNCKHGTARLYAGVLDIHWQDGRHETFGAAAGTGGGADPMAFTHEWHQGILEDFVQAIQEKRPPLAAGRDALAVHRLIDALVRSSTEERSISLAPDA